MRVMVAACVDFADAHAHAINVMKMAQGFARNGHEVTLVCRRPRERRLRPEEINAALGIAESVRYIQLPAFLGRDWPFAFFALLSASRLQPQLVYARHYHLPWLTSRAGIPTVAESHAGTGDTGRRVMRLVKAARLDAFRLWVTISERLSSHYAAIGVPRSKLAVLPDAVDLELFARPHSLPPSPYGKGPPNIVYAGHLYDWKGIPTILNTAKLMPDAQFHLVGGLDEDIQRQRASVAKLGLANVTLHGRKAHAEVPPFLWHASVLLLPPSALHPSAQWTSPLKLGEYLCSGVPIVATSIPALRDWVTDKEVFFVEPDNAGAMARGITSVLGDPQYAGALAGAAQAKANRLSYTERARRILEHPMFLPGLSPL